MKKNVVETLTLTNPTNGHEVTLGATADRWWISSGIQIGQLRSEEDLSKAKAMYLHQGWKITKTVTTTTTFSQPTAEEKVAAPAPKTTKKTSKKSSSKGSKKVSSASKKQKKGASWVFPDPKGSGKYSSDFFDRGRYLEIGNSKGWTYSDQWGNVKVTSSHREEVYILMGGKKVH